MDGDGARLRQVDDHEGWYLSQGSRDHSAEIFQDALDKPSNGCLTKEMVAFKTAIDEHFTAPGLMEAFKGIHTIHPQWNMPDWFTEKLEIQVEQSKQEVLVDETDQKAEKLE